MSLGTCDLVQYIREDCWHFLVNLVIDQLGLSDWNGSANSLHRAQMNKGKSFMYRENKSGSHTEPCGTPYFKGSKSDLELFMQTSCYRFDRNEETNLRVSCDSPRRRSWSITSNALVKSTKTIAENSFMFVCHLSTSVGSVVWHEWCSLKPDWLGCSSWFALRWDKRCLFMCFFQWFWENGENWHEPIIRRVCIISNQHLMSCPYPSPENKLKV